MSSRSIQTQARLIYPISNTPSLSILWQLSVALTEFQFSGLMSLCFDNKSPFYTGAMDYTELRTSTTERTTVQVVRYPCQIQSPTIGPIKPNNLA